MSSRFKTEEAGKDSRSELQRMKERLKPVALVQKEEDKPVYEMAHVKLKKTTDRIPLEEAVVKEEKIEKVHIQSSVLKQIQNKKKKVDKETMDQNPRQLCEIEEAEIERINHQLLLEMDQMEELKVLKIDTHRRKSLPSLFSTNKKCVQGKDHVVAFIKEI